MRDVQGRVCTWNGKRLVQSMPSRSKRRPLCFCPDCRGPGIAVSGPHHRVQAKGGAPVGRDKEGRAVVPATRDARHAGGCSVDGAVGTVVCLAIVFVQRVGCGVVPRLCAGVERVQHVPSQVHHGDGDTTVACRSLVRWNTRHPRHAIPVPRDGDIALVLGVPFDRWQGGHPVHVRSTWRKGLLGAGPRSGVLGRESHGVFCLWHGGRCRVRAGHAGGRVPGASMGRSREHGCPREVWHLVRRLQRRVLVVGSDGRGAQGGGDHDWGVFEGPIADSSGTADHRHRHVHDRNETPVRQQYPFELGDGVVITLLPDFLDRCHAAGR